MTFPNTDNQFQPRDGIHRSHLARRTHGITIFGADGRSAATFAALTLANACHALGEPMVLARLSDGPMVLGGLEAAGIPVIEVPGHVGAAASLVARARAEAAERSAHLLIDLPSEALEDVPETEVCVMVIGPYPTDTVAATLRARELQGRRLKVLACSRGSWGGDKVMSLAALDGHADQPGADVLPMTLARPTSGEAALLMSGRGSPRLLRAGMALLRCLDAASRMPLPVASVRKDDRCDPDRLRDLADALEAAMDGCPPSPADLAAAPVLEGWRHASRPAPVLVGVVVGHASIPGGRPVVTSKVYMTDNRTWARTLSRLYALGRKAGATQAAPLH